MQAKSSLNSNIIKPFQIHFSFHFPQNTDEKTL